MRRSLPVSAADVLRAATALSDQERSDPEVLSALGAMLGMVWHPGRPKRADQDSTTAVEIKEDRFEGSLRLLKPPPPLVKHQQVFWRVYSQVDKASGRTTAPSWLSEQQPGDGDVTRYVSTPGASPPQVPAWLDADTLKTWLHRILARRLDQLRIDTGKAVRRVATGQSLDPLPLLASRQSALANSVLVVWDSGETLKPFHPELRGVLGLLRSVLGGQVEVMQVRDAPQIADRRLSADGRPVIMLGDVGLCGPTWRQQAWIQWLRQLNQAGVRPLVLAPVPQRWLMSTVLSCCDVLLLETGRVPRSPTVALPNGLRGQSSALAMDEGWQWLRCCLFSHSYVTPLLLRRLRLALQRGGLRVDIGTELAVWHGEGVGEEGIACALLPEAVEACRQKLVQLRECFPGAFEAVVLEHVSDLRTRSPLLLAIYASEMNHPDLLVRDLALREEVQSLQTAGRDLMRAMVRVLHHGPEGYRGHGLTEQLLKYQQWLGEYAPGTVGRGDEALQAAWFVAQRDRRRSEGIQVPSGLDLNALSWAWAESENARPQGVAMYVQAGDPPILCIEAVDSANKTASQVSLWAGSVPSGIVTVVENAADHGTTTLLRPSARLALDTRKRYKVDLGHTVLMLESFVRPDWADAISFDVNHWHATLPDGRRLIWVPQQNACLMINNQVDHWQSFELKAAWWDSAEWFSAAQAPAGVPLHFLRPRGAIGHGVDPFGWWADFEIKGVIQRMRFVQPGEFLMGPPENEKDRLASETQHPVLLTQGYWLADTACTQALWEAVMGSNPSRFKSDPNLPVENVSWDDITQKFLPRLNELMPGLNMTLPTEAQWEYACRAGTATPFSFGEQITTDQVNYDGNYPYGGWPKGQYREKTVPVKSLPANPWGLHEMHGNVGEWCADEFAAYGENLAIDPKGPLALQDKKEGRRRVLRGGCWIRGGWNCRSAYRDWSGSAGRFNFIGFRLARGLADQSDQLRQFGELETGTKVRR